MRWMLVLMLMVAVGAEAQQQDTVGLGNGWDGDVFLDPFDEVSWVAVNKTDDDDNSIWIVVYPNAKEGQQLWLVYGEDGGTPGIDSRNWQLRVDQEEIFKTKSRSTYTKYGEYDQWSLVRHEMLLADVDTLFLMAQMSGGKYLFGRCLETGQRIEFDLKGSARALQWLCAHELARPTLLKISEPVMEGIDDPGF